MDFVLLLLPSEENKNNHKINFTFIVCDFTCLEVTKTNYISYYFIKVVRPFEGKGKG